MHHYILETYTKCFTLNSYDRRSSNASLYSNWIIYSPPSYPNPWVTIALTLLSNKDGQICSKKISFWISSALTFNSPIVVITVFPKEYMIINKLFNFRFIYNHKSFTKNIFFRFKWNFTSSYNVYIMGYLLIYCNYHIHHY